MKDQINALIVERGDLKQHLTFIFKEIKQIAEGSGLLSDSDKNQLSAESMGGMGGMMQIAGLLSKLAPLKAAFPLIQEGFLLLMKVNEVNEQIQACHTMILLKLIKGADDDNS